MPDSAGGGGSTPQQQQQQQHWAALLAEAAAKSKGQSKLSAGTLLFLGDAAVGKTRLVNRFCAAYDHHTGKQAPVVGAGAGAGAERATIEEEEQEGRGAGREACGLPLLSYSYFDALDPAGGVSDGGSSSSSSSSGESMGSGQTSGRGTSQTTRPRRNNDNDAGGNDDDDDDDVDSAARVNVWSLSDPTYKNLLQVAFDAAQDDCCDKEEGDQSTKTERNARKERKSAARAEALQRTVCMIGVDMTRPWACEAALQRWMGVLKAVLAEAGGGEGGRGGGGGQGDMGEGEEETTRKARLAAYLAKCYGGGFTSTQRRQQHQEQPHDEQHQHQQQEEGKDGDDEVFRVHKSSPIKNRTASSRRAASSFSSSSSSSLPPGVLTENLGVPLIVVGLKSDLVHAPDSFGDEQRSQFLQQYLRAFCLKHGAALVYVSAARDTNRLLLQRYLLHRLYPEFYSFSLHAQARREQALFLPAGWDSQEIVRKLLSPQSLPWPASAAFSQVLLPPKGVRVPVVGEGGGKEEDGEEEEGEEGGSNEEVSPTRAWLEELLQQQQQQLQQLDMTGGSGETSAGTIATTSRRTGEDKTKPSSGGGSKGSSSSGGSGSSSRLMPPPPALAGAAAASGGSGGSDKAQIRNFFEGLLAGGGASGGGASGGGKK